MEKSPLECEAAIIATVTEPAPRSDEHPICSIEENTSTPPEPTVSIASVHPKPSAVPLAAALGAIGATIVGGLVGVFVRRLRKKKSSEAKAAAATPAVTPITATRPVSQSEAPEVDLSPFGSPVRKTPVRIPPTHKSDGMRTRSTMPDSDADDQSDNASVRDQRHSTLIDASQLQKTLKQMQEMAEENRKLSVFLAEYKADAEKLSRLEEENRALRGVTRQLEVELQDLKTNTMPRTGAELEMFKNSVRVPAVARSVCSNDETIALGVSTASVDGINPDARVRRSNVFRQLLSALQGNSSSTHTSQPTSPRGGTSANVISRGVGASGAGGGTSSRQRRQPGPEEAAVIGHAVYQLLDQFGGRMM